jgi:hypothetical protein
MNRLISNNSKSVNMNSRIDLSFPLWPAFFGVRKKKKCFFPSLAASLCVWLSLPPSLLVCSENCETVVVAASRTHDDEMSCVRSTEKKMIMLINIQNPESRDIPDSRYLRHIQDIQRLSWAQKFDKAFNVDK